MHDFRRLRVWHEARELGAAVYEVCGERPTADPSITTQLRRSALWIAANIAEGCGKGSRAETLRYLQIASGSATETEHHLEVARDVGVLTTELCEDLLARTATVRRMLRGLISELPS